MNSLNLGALFTAFVGDGDRDDIRSWALLLAGGSVILACFLTAFLIGEHLTAYNKPEVNPLETQPSHVKVSSLNR